MSDHDAVKKVKAIGSAGSMRVKMLRTEEAVKAVDQLLSTISGLQNRLEATSRDVTFHFDRANKAESGPIPMRLHCPVCNELHVDEGAFATKPHHTHACQKCGNVWRPAIVPTVGVQFLPGFKNQT